MFRGATRSDLPEILKIYARAREAMAAAGNPAQWGASFRPEAVLYGIRMARDENCVFCNFHKFFARKPLRLHWSADSSPDRGAPLRNTKKPPKRPAAAALSGK